MTKQEQIERWMEIIVQAKKAEREMRDLADILVGSKDFLEDSIGREARSASDSVHALIQTTRRSIKHYMSFDE